MNKYFEIKKRLNYNSETGILSWAQPRSNRVKTGDVAGSMDKDGYICIFILGKIHKAHRIVWLYTYGEWPTQEIDHIDGNPSNNRLNNLREATRSENAANRRKAKNNRSGYVGVSWNSSSQKWLSQIRYKKAVKHLGYFDTPKAASAAYEAAATKLFGKFKRTA